MTTPLKSPYFPYSTGQVATALLDNVSTKWSSDRYCPEAKQSSRMEMKRRKARPVSPTIPTCSKCRQQAFSSIDSTADCYSPLFWGFTYAQVLCMRLFIPVSHRPNSVSNTKAANQLMRCDQKELGKPLYPPRFNLQAQRRLWYLTMQEREHNSSYRLYLLVRRACAEWKQTNSVCSSPLWPSINRP